MTGPAKVIVELARETMRDSGGVGQIEITVATFLRNATGNSFTRAILDEGIPLEIIDERSAFDPGVVPQMRRLLARSQPDILWTHAVKSHFLVRLAGLHRNAHWIASHHGYTTTDLKTRTYNELDRWSHRGAERVITVCRKFANDLEKRGIRPDRIRVQHNPVRTPSPVSAEQLAQVRHELNANEGTSVLLSVGRLSQEKGHSDLIQALAQLRPLLTALPLLVLVGDGPERANLRTLARTLKVADRVLFAGHQSDVRPYYAAAHLFVLPSLSEGSPNVLLEAMDAGLPVVATAVGGIPEIVTDNASALLVPAQDPAALAAAIARLLQDAPLQARLTAEAREALKRHTPDIYFRELRQIFSEVARG